MITRRDAIVGALLTVPALMTKGAANPPEYILPLHFPSFDELERWAKQCLGNGWCRKFAVFWEGRVVDLCYSKRSFSSGVASYEITFWRPDGDGGWLRVVGTTIMDAELKVTTYDGGCVISAIDTRTNSWETWMTITTAMLCNRIENAGANGAKSGKADPAPETPAPR
jgi:hypothetical protein